MSQTSFVVHGFPFVLVSDPRATYTEAHTHLGETFKISLKEGGGVQC